MSTLTTEELAAKFLACSDIKTRGVPNENREVEVFTAPEGGNKIEACVGRLKALASSEGRPVIQISPITREEVEILERELSTEGLKFRFDWDAKSSTALFRMPKLLHSGPLTTWAAWMLPDVQKALKAVALCGRHILLSGGDAECELKDGSLLCPDAAFGVYDNKRASMNPQLTPRVVFECALSQSLSAAKKKAWKYLFQTKDPYGVHAVVLCNMENPPRWSGKKLCRLTLDIWVREETGNVEIDYPLDECPPAPDDGQSTSEEEEAPDVGPSLSNRGSSAGASSDHATWSSNEVTMTNDPNRFWSPNKKAARMWRRNDEVTVVYDEACSSNQEALPPFELDVYDFLRTCNTRPHRSIPGKNRPIFVDLEELRTTVRLIVQGQRDLQQPVPQQSNEGATPQPTGSGISQLKRAREAPEPSRKAKKPHLDQHPT